MVMKTVGSITASTPNDAIFTFYDIMHNEILFTYYFEGVILQSFFCIQAALLDYQINPAMLIDQLAKCIFSK